MFAEKQVMFNLLAVRSAALPRLKRLIADQSTPAELRIQLEDQLEHEKAKASQGARENALRRHNLLPAVFAMLTAMGKSGQMGESALVKAAPFLTTRQSSRRGSSQGQGKA